MARPEIEPTEITEDGPVGGTRRSHPAFAIIGAHRYSGGSDTLYGSPLKHHGGITVTIQFSDEHVSIGSHNYWPRHHAPGGATIAEVTLSEAQWATFVSTLNVGSGVPCTARYVKTGPTESLPGIVDKDHAKKRSEFIHDQTAELTKRVHDVVAEMDRLLAQPSFKRSELKGLRSKMSTAIDHMPGNMQFTADMLTEHNEKLIESAKAEVSAMVTRMAMQFPQLASSGVDVAQIEDKSDV